MASRDTRWLLSAVASLLALLVVTGCQTMAIPSYRSPGEPTRATYPPEQPERDQTSRPCALACAEPSAAWQPCLDGSCPPLIALPALSDCHLLGALSHGDSPWEPAELKPPHSRFLPVPTQPVFSPRPEYDAPEPILQPVPASRHPAEPGMLP